MSPDVPPGTVVLSIIASWQFNSDSGLTSGSSLSFLRPGH